jgi:hypothetical protein
MYRVRKVRTKSGSTAIHMVQYIGHQAKITKHIGSAKDDIEFELISFLPSHYSFTILH